MARPRRRKLSKKESKAAKKAASFSNQNEKSKNQTDEKLVVEKEIALPPIIMVQDFAEKIGVSISEVISELMKNGLLATINDSIDFETAAIIGDELGVKIIAEKSKETKEVFKKASIDDHNKKNLSLRPPVVTIMGHVDHGKTTLLDTIRRTKVVSSESGGITQHISAYQITLDKIKNKNIKNRTITFIDTPGHAAFSAIRSHGTAITDIVVLIVAADDGIMPQTEEVIKQAKINHVPIIVAINKIDLPNADIMKTKKQLADFDLVPEEWGGKTVVVEISAEENKNIDSLLEMILIQTEMMELVADPKQKAIGVVIESHMHKGAGALALVLVENGTLRLGDPIQIGSSWGKVRILEDYNRNSIKEALPSQPVRVAGMKSLPEFGQRLIVHNSEKEAEKAAEKSKESVSLTQIASAKRVGIEEVADDIKKGKTECLNVILKADVQGSLEAIRKSLEEIDTKEIKMQIVSQGIGPISESDITFASTCQALVLGFRVKELQIAKKIAQKEKIPVQLYDVIYQLIDDVKGVLSGLLPPEIIEGELASGKVLEIFRQDKKGIIAGGVLKEGKATLGNEIKTTQDDNEKWRGKITSLRREKNEVKEVEVGQEFGFGVAPDAKIAVGDKFIIFKTVEKNRTIE